VSSVLFVTFYDEFALGIRSLASYLDQFGHETHLCFFKEFKVTSAPYLLKNPRNYQTIHAVNECGMFTCAGADANPWTEEEEGILFLLIQDIQPTIVCISIRNFIDEEICDLFRCVRQFHPAATYIAGGFGPTFVPEKYLGVFDYVVRGEGEEPIREIVDAVDRKQKSGIKKLKNISYKNDGKCVHNPLRPLIDNLNNLPFPKLSADGNCYFIEDGCLVNDERAKTYSILVGRGCPNHCSYCCAGEWRGIYHSSGHKAKPYRQRSLDRVIQEVRRAGENGFRFLNIADSFLAISTSQQRQLFTEIKKQNMRFSAQFHPEVTLKEPDILRYAHACGLRTTVVGVQHGSERFSREVYCRSNSNTRILQWARLASSLPHIEVQYHFITGNPLETDYDFDEHLDFIRTLRDDPEIRIDELSFNVLKLFPNTSLTKRLQEQGLQQSMEDAVYKSSLSILCLMLSDKEFSHIYSDLYYKEQPLFLIPRVYEAQMRKNNNKLVKDTNPSQIVFDLVTRKMEEIPVSGDIQSITRDGQGNINIISKGCDPWLLLENLPLETNKRYSCQWVLQVPNKNVKTQLFYLPVGENGQFSEENSAVFIQNCEICFNKIALDGIEPMLRIDIGDTPGNYLLHYLIIRSID
jgi:radical SAM superfamily enzyme YgiQ (UPF0313 family)